MNCSFNRLENRAKGIPCRSTAVASSEVAIMATIIERESVVTPALERRLERLGLAGHEREWADRYLLCNHLLNSPTAEPRQKFEATSRFIRDLIAHRWAKTQRAREEGNP